MAPALTQGCAFFPNDGQYGSYWSRSQLRGEDSRDADYGNIVSGTFTPVLAKHTKSFNLIDTLSVGVDRIQRNFEPLQRQVETWRKTQITDDTAKLIFYSFHRRQVGGAQKFAA